MSVPSWILVAILKAIGPRLIEEILEALIRWAENQKNSQKPQSPDIGDEDGNGLPDFMEDL